MHRLVLFFLGSLLLLAACRKDPAFPGNPNHEVKATVAFNNDPSFSFNATGNSTVYSKHMDSNGDNVTGVYGNTPQGAIQLNLINITAPGTYSFSTGAAGSSYIMCNYTVGNPLIGFFELYTTGNAPNGTITISELTATSIKGTFSADPSNANGVVHITNGSFKGTF
jgi:hypothetical protein